MTRRLAFLAAIGLLGALGSVAIGAAEPTRPQAPKIVFFDAKGQKTGLDAFAGKVVVLSFWASWCLPCRDEMPSFDRMQQRLDDRGLRIVPVSIDARGLEAVDGFYAERAIAHLPRFTDPSREAAKALGFIGIPSALILDRQGGVAARIEGPINWDSARIASLIDKLLDAP